MNKDIKACLMLAYACGVGVAFILGWIARGNL
jgi:hypothetical protein